MARNSAGGEFDDVDTNKLGMDDLKDIIDEVSDLGSNRPFGIALGLRAPDLDKIDEEERKVDKKLEKTVSLYLNQKYNIQRHGPPNWKSIVLAVFTRNPRLARDIAAKHKRAHLQHPSHPHPSPAGSGQVQGVHPPHLQCTAQPFVAAVPATLTSGSAQAQGRSDDSYGHYLDASSKSVQMVYEHWQLKKIHGYGIDGSGTTIAIIDDGVYYKHRSMCNKDHTTIAIIDDGVSDKHRSMCNKDEPPKFKIDGTRQICGNAGWDDSRAKHGTAVAAVAAGDGFTVVTTTQSEEPTTTEIPSGIAPNANIYIYRMEDVNEKEVSAALDHILQLDPKEIRIDIVVMAFGLAKRNEEIEKQLAKLAERKIVCIAAAGNSGDLTCRAEFPASCKDVLSVGALSDLGDKSALTPPDGIDVFAFGEGVLVPSVREVNATTKLDGTSFAVPMVAGFLSLLFHCTKLLPPGTKDVGDKYHNVDFLKDHFKSSEHFDQKRLNKRVFKYFDNLWKCQDLDKPPIVTNYTELYDLQ